MDGQAFQRGVNDTLMENRVSKNGFAVPADPGLTLAAMIRISCLPHHDD
jgi:hypothetical protein